MHLNPDEKLNHETENESIHINPAVTETAENTTPSVTKGKKRKSKGKPSRDDQQLNALRKTLAKYSRTKLNQEDIGKKMAEFLEDGKPVDQGRVSILINKLIDNKEAVKDEKTGIYKLTEKGAFAQPMIELEDFFDWTTGSKPVFETEVKIGVLKAYARRNGILAQEIKKTFKSKIVSIFCPNDTDIVIFYKEGPGEEILEQELQKLCKKSTIS